MDTLELNKIFSKNLRYWLEYRGKTQADLCKVIGVSSATVSDWCNEKKMPKMDKIVDICRWLMIEISDLISEKTNHYDDTDSIFYRIKDDAEFKALICDINTLNTEQFHKVLEYIKFLKDQGEES